MVTYIWPFRLRSYPGASNSKVSPLLDFLSSLTQRYHHRRVKNPFWFLSFRLQFCLGASKSKASKSFFDSPSSFPAPQGALPSSFTYHSIYPTTMSSLFEDTTRGPCESFLSHTPAGTLNLIFFFSLPPLFNRPCSLKSLLSKMQTVELCNRVKTIR